MKPRFLPIYRLAKLIMSIVCWMAAAFKTSSVRELNDKYPGSYPCLLQHWNRESYTIMLTVGVIILEHPMSGVVLKLFQPAKSKIH